MSAESTGRSGDCSWFHAREAATANERSPSDDVVRGTATEPDVADLRPALAVVEADGVIRSANQGRPPPPLDSHDATTFPSPVSFSFYPLLPFKF